MRIVTTVLAGFVAVAVAKRGTLTSKPDSDKAFDNAQPSESAQIDGNWRIGCDKGNYCSYYHGAAAATGIAARWSAHADIANNVECIECTAENPCDPCDPSAFQCPECKHYQCNDDSTNTPVCIDLPPLQPSTMTKRETAAAARRAESRETNTTSPILLLDLNHDGFDRRSQNVSRRANMHPLSGRRVAFSGEQCVKCDASSCPECLVDCPECQHFKCFDPVTSLSMCMSVRPKYLVPCDPVPPPVSIVTETMYFLPAPTPTAASATTVKRTRRSASATATITASPPAVTVSNVVTKTSTVYTPQPSKSTTTIYVEVSVLPIASSTPKSPSTKPIVLATGTKSLIPRTPTTASPSNAPRATSSTTPVSTQHYNANDASCTLCNDLPECKDCDFLCPECPGHMICANALFGSKVCVEMLQNSHASRATASEGALGRAATLRVSRGAQVLVNANASRAVEQGDGSARPLVAFEADECRDCGRGEQACSACEWRFACGSRTKCSRSWGDEAVEMCYETGETCPV